MAVYHARAYYKSSETLCHYGVKGMKWGIRHDRERIGRRRRSQTENKVDKRSAHKYNSKQKGLTAGQKRALRLGAAVALTAVAIYGAKKMGYLDSADLAAGRKYAKAAVNTIGSTPVSQVKTPRPKQQAAQKSKPKPIIRDPRTGFKMIHETVEDSLKNTNPLRGTKEGGNNCTYCAIAGAMRMMGLDVKAKGTPGAKMQNMAGVLEDAFKNVKVYEGSATRFAKSPDEAGAMLKKRFGDNAHGAVGVDWKGGRGGHTFNWSISNGVVEFLDFQQKTRGASVERDYWNGIDPNGNLTFARLDIGKDGKPIEVNLDAIKKYVSG